MIVKFFVIYKFMQYFVCDYVIMFSNILGTTFSICLFLFFKKEVGRNGFLLAFFFFSFLFLIYNEKYNR